MTFGPNLRKAGVLLHVLSSVGWFGAVAAFEVLAVIAWRTVDPSTLAGAATAMRAITWAVLVPAALSSFVTGVIQSLGTPWGLIRHHWVLIKLVLTFVSIGLLLLHTAPIDALATDPGTGEAVRLQLMLNAAQALLVLVLLTALSVVKPKGTTAWGRPTPIRAPIPE